MTKITNKQLETLRALFALGNGTTEEIADELSITTGAARGRLKALEAKSLIECERSEGTWNNGSSALVSFEWSVDSDCSTVRGILAAALRRDRAEAKKAKAEEIVEAKPVAETAEKTSPYTEGFESMVSFVREQSTETIRESAEKLAKPERTREEQLSYSALLVVFEEREGEEACEQLMDRLDRRASEDASEPTSDPLPADASEEPSAPGEGGEKLSRAEEIEAEKAEAGIAEGEDCGCGSGSYCGDPEYCDLAAEFERDNPVRFRGFRRSG